MQATIGRLAARWHALRASAAAPNAKPLWRQLVEIVRLRSSSTRLSAEHYFWLNLGNREVYRDVDLGRFGSAHHSDELHLTLNSPRWDAVVTDKLVMSVMFTQCGIPQPVLYAAACRFPRRLGEVPIFQDRASLAAFMRESIPLPFFCKPVKGGSAKGCYRIEARDESTQQLIFADGSRMSPEDFIGSLRDPEGWGFLFQEAVKPHAGTKEICGDSVSGCRVVMLVGDDGPRIKRVAWKIPVGGAYVDNFVSGKSGNLLADVDPEDGRVRRVVSGAGTKLQVNPPFPSEGRSLVGWQLPDWQQVREVMLDAALAFPGFRLQSWDIGLTDRGCVIYELNTAGDVYISELASGTGIFDDEFKAFLERYGNQASRRPLAGQMPVTD